MADTFARVRNIVGNTAAWAADDIVLGSGEIGIERVSGSDVRIKVGDGTTAWSALPYASASSTTINTATQTALDAKLALAGGTMSGLLILSGDPVADLGAVTKQYVDSIDDTLSTSVSGKLSLTGGTLTGFLTLDDDPSSDLHAATKQYVDDGDDAKVTKSGDTMSGYLVLHADPSSAMQAATKQYVDGGAYQTVVGGSSTYAGKVVRTNASGVIDSSLVPLAGGYQGAVDVTAAYALTGPFTVGDYFAVSASGTIDASWNTYITGSPSTAGAGQFLIYNVSGDFDLIGDTTSSSAITGKLDKTGGTMTGAIVLPGNPSAALEAAPKQYVDTMVPLAGGTMSGLLILSGAPATGLGAATKTYVDTADALAALKSNNLSDLASAATARTNLGGTTVGKDLFTTASASAARTTLGATSVGGDVFTAASAAAARSTLGAAASGSNTDITSIALANTGLKIADTDASHNLSVVPGSNLSANRTLTLTTGDANRTLDLSAGNATVLDVATAAEFRGNSANKTLATNNVWSAAAPVALTWTASGTTAVDLSTGLNFTVTTATGNSTLGAPSNAKAGQSGFIYITQGATPRTLAFASAWVFAGGTDPTLTATGASKDVLFYQVLDATGPVVFGNLVKGVA